jgi:diguanylate cyclase (GGDEF)-like protein
VTSKQSELSRWLRAAPQATTFFGLAMVALIWGAVEFHLNTERELSKTGAIRSMGNLARVFDEQIVRTIKANDRILRSLQLSSVNETLSADFSRWVSEIDDQSNLTAQLSLVGADGWLTATSLDFVTEAMDRSDRDYFKVHRDSPEAGLFISKPVFGRVSRKWLIQLTRALRGRHGAFSGVAVVSLSSAKLTQFYESVDLGRDGAIILVGLDGVVRASAGMRVDAIGTSMAGSELLRRAALADEGSFTSRGTIDGVTRVASYRVIEGFPLVLLVARADHVVFAGYWRNRIAYRVTAAGLTVFILIFMLISIRHRQGLERARQELRASETIAREKSRELELTLDHMSQGIMMVDSDLKVALMNRQAVELLGLPEDLIAQRPQFEKLVAHQWSSGEFGNDGMAVQANLRESIQAGPASPILKVYERTRPNGVVLEVRSINLPDGGFVRTFSDISERKQNEEEIAHLAHHDALTGLANRVLLRSHIDVALGRYRRQREEFALLSIDLDGFKSVNDTLGHAAGDELLRCVAQRLRDCVRETDTVARLGGDEFAVLQVMTENREGIEVLARRILEKVGAPYTLDGRSAVVAASIGIARCVDGSSVEELFQNADLALYRVKSEGRNGYRMFEAEMDVAARARHQMEGDLRVARERGQFEIVYQPMFDLASRKIASVEALLRWNHPSRGLISPADFIPLAEEIGVMPSIDAWVLETACAEAAGWPGDASIAINLSPEKFKRRTLLDVVRRVLLKSGLPARRLELEISERILLREEKGSLALLRGVRDLGVRVALDDFGVAHSSLSDLRVFSFDKIKIDRSFVAEMESSKESAAIVAAIAGLGRSLGAEITAEGVETEAQAKLVRAAGCTQAQGYLYSRPLPVAAIRALLAERGPGHLAVA